MEVWFRVYVLGPLLRRHRIAQARRIREEIDQYQWAYGNRVPDDFSNFCTAKIKELKEELRQVLSR